MQNHNQKPRLLATSLWNIYKGSPTPRIQWVSLFSYLEFGEIKVLSEDSLAS